MDQIVPWISRINRPGHGLFTFSLAAARGMYPFKVTPKTCTHNKISKTKGFGLIPHWHIMSKRLLGTYQFPNLSVPIACCNAATYESKLGLSIHEWWQTLRNWQMVTTAVTVTLISQKQEEILGEPTNAAIEVCSLWPITVSTAHRTMHSDSWREQISFSDCPFMKLEGQLQTSGVLQNSSWNTCANWQQSRSC